MKKIVFFLLLIFSSQAGCTLTDPEVMEMLQALQAQNDKLLEEITSMKGQLTALDGKYQVIQAGLADNKKELEALKSQMDGLKTQIASQLVKLNQLIAQLEVQGADLEKLSAEIVKVKASIEELKALMEELLASKSPIPTNGLVAWYPFNGNANDESGKENNGVVSGATLTTDRFNAQNRSYRFRGFGFRDHIRIPFSASLSNQGSFSFSLFFLLENGALMNGNGSQGGSLQSGAILTREGDGIGTSPGFFSEVKIVNSQVRTGYYFSEGCCTARTYQERVTEFTVPNISLNNWVHLAVTVSSTEYKIFINGELKLTKPLNSNLNVMNNLDYYIGIFGSGRANLPTWYPFLGKIDDVAIYNRILTPEEVAKIFKEEKF
jgi:hypothetical protein